MAQRTYVLRIGAVRAAIETLKPLHIHETFSGFLHLRKQAAGLNRYTDLQPEWKGELASWLLVPGGPPGKPYFRPFSSRGTDFWLNQNLAGSYAQSSLRPALRELYFDGDSWRIPTLASGLPDAQKVQDLLLAGKPIPAWAVAAYLYRNRQLIAGEDLESDPSDGDAWQGVLDLFQDQFRWSDNEIDLLFTWEIPEGVSPLETWSIGDD